MKQKQFNEAFNKGYNAASEGQLKTTNPYKSKIFQDAWTRGWERWVLNR